MLMLLAVLRELGPYAWFIVGALFLIAETILPGASLIWFGVAASLTGALVFVWPLAWEGQMIAFLAFSGATVALGRMIAARVGGVGEAEVNRGANALLGRVLSLAEPIENGFGRAAWGDGLWRVTGPDLPAGTRVRVVGVEAATLRVEPAGAGDKDVRNATGPAADPSAGPPHPAG